RTRKTATHDAQPNTRPARRRAIFGLGFPWRRSAGSVDNAIVSPACALQNEFAGSDRFSDLAFRAFPDLILAGHRPSRRTRARKTCTEVDHRRVEKTRAYRRDWPGLVGRPAYGGIA